MNTLKIDELNNYFGGAEQTLKAWTGSAEYNKIVNDANNTYLTEQEMYDLALSVAIKWESKVLKRSHLTLVRTEH